jgi:hypothetical protein
MILDESATEQAHVLYTTREIDGGETGYMVHVLNGPEALLWRRSEDDALRDGAAYIRTNWVVW